MNPQFWHWLDRLAENLGEFWTWLITPIGNISLDGEVIANCGMKYTDVGFVYVCNDIADAGATWTQSPLALISLAGISMVIIFRIIHVFNPLT